MSDSEACPPEFRGFCGTKSGGSRREKNLVLKLFQRDPKNEIPLLTTPRQKPRNSSGFIRVCPEAVKGLRMTFFDFELSQRRREIESRPKVNRRVISGGLRGLLQRHAVQGPQAPYQIHGVNAHDLSVRKQGRKGG